MNIKTAAITMSVVVATIIVAGALVFPYNYAMAGKNQDASKSNTHNGVQIGGTKDNGNVGHGNTGTANIGNGNVGSHNVGNGNTGRNNIRNGNTGSNFVGDPIPGVDCSTPLHPRC
ncbi:MAG: pentapeptide repeat-containing protein [Candidatus Nitrosopolaris sp.]